MRSAGSCPGPFRTARSRRLSTTRGRLVRAASPAAKVEWAYDPCGRVVAETLNGRTVTHTYDATGYRVSRSSPFHRELGFEYDGEGRLVGAAADGATLFRSILDGLGREQRRVTPAGTTWEWDYLPTGETTAVRVRGRAAFERRYGYDAAGDPTGQDDPTFGSAEYRHDADGYLTAVRYSDGDGQAFSYDRAGNITLPPQFKVQRDADGNVVEKRGPDGNWRFSYDPLGRLTRANSDGGAEVSFAYDPLGRRVRKESGSGATDYYWDGDLPLGETSARGDTEYLFRPGTFVPIAQFDRGGAALLECDPVGLPRSAVTPDGEVVWQAAFDPFGGARAERGRPGFTDLRYPGQAEDPESGLFYNRFRFYDPDLQAYLTPDPLGLMGGGEVWNYVPSPLHWVDPYGLACTVGGPHPIWSSTGSKTSVENTLGHWNKHGAEFPQFQNAKQYVQGAHNFVHTPPSGTHIKTRANGDKVFFDPATDTFAVQGANNAPKTMFKPDPAQHGYPSNLDYFNAQAPGASTVVP